VNIFDTLFGNSTTSRILEITASLIIIYLVVSNGKEFGAVVSSVGTSYAGAVKALQGR
jgi:hypothetical protein